MAKVKLNPLFNAIQGELNGYIFRVTPDGRTIVSKSPDMSQVKWSKAQKAHRQRFREANDYAKAVMANPEVRLRYEKKAKKLKKTSFALAVSDYFKGINLLQK
jgi:hypothetical protein